MKALPRWGEGIVGQAKPDALLESEHSRLQLFRRTVRIDGFRVTAGGIGGVWTDPAHRKQGHASTLLEVALQELKEKWRTDIAVLFSLAGTIPFYGARGWLLLPPSTRVLIGQPRGSIDLPALVCCFARPLRNGPLYQEPRRFEIEGLPW